MGNKLKVLYLLLDFFFPNTPREQKNISTTAHVNASISRVSTFRKFFEYVGHTVAVSTIAVHVSLRSLFFELPIFILRGYYIFSYWVTVSQGLCAEDSCNLMFWIKGNDAIAVRKVEDRATKFFEIPSLTKKLWKFRLRRKIRISGSERQIMREAIIRWSVRSQFSPFSMERRIALGNEIKLLENLIIMRYQTEMSS